MTKEEFAQIYVDSLTEQQCRQILAKALLATFPAIFLKLEQDTTPNWYQQQELHDAEMMRNTSQAPLQNTQSV